VVSVEKIGTEAEEVQEQKVKKGKEVKRRKEKSGGRDRKVVQERTKQIKISTEWEKEICEKN
jgi:hypothetical protein